jgi:coproporphyrinogen III oxidase
LTSLVDVGAVRDYLTGLQDRIVARLEAIDGGSFRRDAWDRRKAAGRLPPDRGRQRARARGVNSRTSAARAAVVRDRAPSRPRGTRVAGDGVSLVLHPRNPHAPTAHMNVRMFVATREGAEPAWWFGGGMDLTPYYGYDEDAVHFHRSCRDAVAPFGTELHPRWKKACDDYFYLKHRREPRGVGGVFFDDLSEGGFERSFAIVRSVGDAFVRAYAPILERRKDLAYGERERDFQAYRRGRYVEFNLVWDRGTLFGLQSNGRTEAILMSLPPVVKWRYDWRPAPGTPEARLYERYLVPRDWADGTADA